MVEGVAAKKVEPVIRCIRGKSPMRKKKCGAEGVLIWLMSLVTLALFLPSAVLDDKSSRKRRIPTTSPATAPPSWTPLEEPTRIQLRCGDGLWHGSFEDLKPHSISPPVSVAIAFCEHSLSWLDPLVQGLNVRNITVYSKCENEVGSVPNRTRIVNLKNVGRVDHSYAFHMANLPEDTDPDEVQLFLKDTYPEFHQTQLRRRPLKDVVQEADGTAGFSCGSTPNWRNTLDMSTFLSKTWFHNFFNYGSEWSAWHLSSEVAKFRLRTYNSAGGYAPRDNVDFSGGLTFKDWFDALELPLPGIVMPVCYAGTFAAKPEKIFASRKVWSRMLKLLERGDNIMEGHYAERTYAAVLMPHIPPRIQEQIVRLSRGVRMCSYTPGFCGLLYGCSDA